MSISSVKPLHASATDVQIDAHVIHVWLLDGRVVSAPLEWFPRLRDASERQRKNWRLIGNGVGIHWPDVDEDIAIAALLEQ